MSVFVCGELAFRPNSFLKKTDPPTESHEHTHPHILIVFSGAVRVECKYPDGTEDHKTSGDYYAPQTLGRMNQPCIVNIKKDCRHKITPLMDNTYYGCAYFHRDPETGEVVSEPNGWEGAWF